MKLRNWHQPGGAGQSNAKVFDIERADISLHPIVVMHGPPTADVNLMFYRPSGHRVVVIMTPAEFEQIATKYLRLRSGGGR